MPQFCSCAFSLFDMDGTLVDSTAGVVDAWKLFAETYPGIDVHEILSSSHGVRTVENLRIHCGIQDPEELEREAVRFEDAIVASAKKDGRQGIVALPGVHAVMDSLRPGAKGPKPVWALCTSATRSYASAALKAAGIDPPEKFVASEDVEKGKPEPDPYLLGAKLLGVDPSRCLVVEDAPAGITSGRAAGCKTLALITSHTREQVEKASPDYIVKDLSSVTMKLAENGGVDVIIN
ncbi:phosphatase [Irpex lacteus]|nr:phosphatase [Irpex lacteus]